MTDIGSESSWAKISDCGCYRFELGRRWAPGDELVWVMLNPSTADADKDDATIRRVRGFTKRGGFAAFSVVNLWAWRATNPRKLRNNPLAYHFANSQHIRRVSSGKDVVVAWGGGITHAAHYTDIVNEAVDALRGAKSVSCLGFTQTRQPRHPLMLSKSTLFIEWDRNFGNVHVTPGATLEE